ncbi:MAG: hypothetical protein L3J79_06020, partial [Candidatus Marinimicrobia bacterium]|nr:hypothetical protein [Candidatus Neomarinimicrobiota bacterium]
MLKRTQLKEKEIEELLKISFDKMIKPDYQYHIGNIPGKEYELYDEEDGYEGELYYVHGNKDDIIEQLKKTFK